MAPQARGRRQPAHGQGSMRRQGPQLPSGLLRDVMRESSHGDDEAQRVGRHQLQVTHGRAGLAARKVRGSRKELRKAHRLEKKASKATQQAARTQARKQGHAIQAVSLPQPGSAPKRTASSTLTQAQRKQPASRPEPAATLKRGPVQMNSGPSKRTRFEELLSGAPTLLAGGRAVNSEAAYVADLRAAREAEKRLGIKKGGVLKGPADGLSSLLSGLTSATGAALPSYLSQGIAAKARSLLAGKAAAAAPAPGGGLDSDSEDELGLGVLAGGQAGTESESEDYDLQGEGESDSSGSDDDDDDEGESGSQGMSDSDADVSGEVSDGSLDSQEPDADSDLEPTSDGDEPDISDEDEPGTSAEDGQPSSEDTQEEEDVATTAQQGGAAGGRQAPGEPSGRLAPSAGGRYVPPALRAAAAAADDSGSGVARRVIGLLNRLAEANLTGIGRDLVELYADNRRQVVATVTAQLLQASVRGPRATPAFATTAAALVAGVAGSAGAAELAAGFLEMAAQQLEVAITDNDSLSAQNLVQLLASCHATSLVSADLMYGLLNHFVNRFTEADVMLMATLLNARGLALRSADPSAMKELVLAVSAKVAAVTQQSMGPAAAAGSSSSSTAGGLSTRARMMLELVIDIKNNRTTKAAGGGAGRNGKGSERQEGGTAVSISPAVAAWLRNCNVDRVAVRNISWEKLLVPNKKGMWWLPEAGEALAARSGGPGSGAQLLAIAAGGGPEAAADAAQLLTLAAAQRMNTDARRAVFVAVMGAADVVNAHERLIKLPLKGDQQREVVRVVVDCCMHEAVYNPFYALLVARLAAHSKAHRLTAQFCMWDQYKVLGELSAAALTHLARLNAVLVVKDTLPITSLKVVDFGTSMDAKPLFFWRVFFQHLLAACSGPAQVASVFGRAGSHSSKQTDAGGSGTTGPGALRAGLLLFLRMRLGPWLAEQDPSVSVGKVSMDELLVRVRLAEATVRGEQAGI